MKKAYFTVEIAINVEDGVKTDKISLDDIKDALLDLDNVDFFDFTDMTDEAVID